ncbi:hypothetical protein BO71DRAFT_480832 [Aspergillus ellipticus CBS 707.79]|uniref:Xylanolytic transcriptional activator regulatory domain-containing protein n=1 Tax=Aspergillus ellipticus CBS 707.79 TaxID=1448320 RepID=A0A319DK88_9EURO|nr:hypothetical protein BO71DRAFT_480832 [Aspergillus ellipticus CBS 707.79]
MFYNFAPPRSLAKRRRVTRACDYCRERQTDPRRHAFEDREGSAVAVCGTTAEASSLGPNDEQPAAEQSPSTLDRLDSTLGFISRINTFCSGISQLLSHPSSTDDPPPAYTSPFGPGVLDETTSTQSTSTECDLTPAQVETLLQVFWTRLHPHVPIIRHEDLEVPSVQDDGKPSHSPLRDALTAYAMQYVFYSGLYSRILGLQLRQFATGNRFSERIGMPYFQRCLATATQYSTFAQPSIHILQCYCIMVLYLLDAGQHQAAYNLIGAAVRIAQSLNLDQDHDQPAGVAPCQETKSQAHLWRTLVHLDFRCSRHLGKPTSTPLPISRSLLPCTISSDNLDHPPYHAQSIRLTYAALAVIESMSQEQHPGDLESQAQLLSRNLTPLAQWRDALQQDKWFKTDLSNNEYMTQPPIQVQTTTLLELQYHDIIISLHRVFITFPHLPLVPRDSQYAGAHAATALNHALATIHTIHRRMSQHDIFYGSCELYQYQWNAFLTLIGFILAFPFCHRCPTAREYVDVALETFEFAGPHNEGAARAACLTQHLRAKVDKLTMVLGTDLRRGSATIQPSSSSANAEPGKGELPPELEKNPDPLWSWVDLIDPNVWPNYCDEVNEAFTGVPEMSLFQDFP